VDPLIYTYTHVYMKVYIYIHAYEVLKHAIFRALQIQIRKYTALEQFFFLSRYKAHFSCAYQIYGTFVRVWKYSLLH